MDFVAIQGRGIRRDNRDVQRSVSDAETRVLELASRKFVAKLQSQCGRRSTSKQTSEQLPTYNTQLMRCGGEPCTEL
jgi:hypothetical protein